MWNDIYGGKKQSTTIHWDCIRSTQLIFKENEMIHNRKPKQQIKDEKWSNQIHSHCGKVPEIHEICSRIENP